MPEQLPPSRYKVIERDRRLIVIDTRTGESASPTLRSPSGAPLVRRDSPRPIASFDDDRGGRLKLALGLGLGAGVFMLILALVVAPWLLIPALFVFAHPVARQAARRTGALMTEWMRR